jgi:hypothetical protein
MAGDSGAGSVRAAYAVELASTFATWVHRRVETFEFPDADTVRRRMSVDFTLPATAEIEKGEQVAVPLMILKREVLRNFDVMDEDGRRLTVLTTDEHREIASTGLRQLLGPSWEDQGRLEELLEALVGSPELAARKSAEEELEAGIEAGLEADVREVLLGLVGVLADGFLLLVEVDYQPGARRLVKFSYDSPLEPDRGFWAWAYRKLSRFASSVGWIGRAEGIDDIQVGWAESYHVEVAPPADTWPAESQLDVGTERLRDRQSRHYLRPHIATGGRQPGETAQLGLLLHPRRDALVLPLLVASTAIAAILAAVPPHYSALDGQTLGALLLVPFALSAFYVRPGEHSYVSRAMVGLRLISGVPVGAGVLVLVLVALGELRCGGDALTIAEWAARASVVAAYLVLVAYVLPTLARPGRAIIAFLRDRTQSWNPAPGLLVLIVLVAIFVAPIVAAGCWVYSLLPY